MIKEIWHDGLFGKAVLILLTLIIISIPWSIYSSIVESIRWNEFKEIHNCKTVGHIDSKTNFGVGITGGGQMATVITDDPAMNGYLCDDGVTYWKED